MKKLFLFLTVLATSFAFIACSDDDDDNGKYIGVNDLPLISQTFLNTHFPKIEADRVLQLDASYNVSLKNGFEIEFNLMGDWLLVNGGNNAVPTTILATVPKNIVTYVATTFPKTTINKIAKFEIKETQSYGYEVKLSNDEIIKFNKDGEANYITFEDLPLISQSFINLHFPEAEIHKVLLNEASYEAHLKNGFKMTFNLTGVWVKIDGGNNGTPSTILATIPKDIVSYIAVKFPKTTINKIEKIKIKDTESIGYEVVLSNGETLQFDKDGKIIPA